MADNVQALVTWCGKARPMLAGAVEAHTVANPILGGAMVKFVLVTLVIFAASGAIAQPSPLVDLSSKTMTIDHAYDASPAMLRKVIRVRGVRCIEEDWGVLCEGKGSGGKSLGFRFTVGADESLPDVTAHLRNHCEGSANLYNRRCKFTILAEIKEVEPTRFVDIGTGRIAVRMIIVSRAEIIRAQ